MNSLHTRLLLIASLVLAAFLGLGALALDRAFRESAELAMRERLQEQIYALLGAAKEDQLGRMRLPDDLPNPRFSSPDSGLYAVAEGEDGHYRWHSFSLVGRPTSLLQSLSPGVTRFNRIESAGQELYVINFGLSWEDDAGNELGYSLAVGESTANMRIQLEGFRTRLFYWLAGVSLLLLISQGAVLGWGLRPLRRVAKDLRRVESGEIDAIQGYYPKELEGLIRNLNALIQSGRVTRDRYRNSLGDLAHSLKTPLTLLQGAATEKAVEAQLRAVIREQVPHMDEIIQYQLRRAAASAVSDPGTSVSLVRVVRRLRATLDKVYHDKQIRCEVDIDEKVRFFGDQADLMEFMGSLMDNAYKYGNLRVEVRGELQLKENDGAAHRLLSISVADDGPGIPVDRRNEVLHRGVRIDQQLPGQGIGLSVAGEIVSLYAGSLVIGDSSLGGAEIQLQFIQG